MQKYSGSMRRVAVCALGAMLLIGAGGFSQSEAQTKTKKKTMKKTAVKAPVRIPVGTEMKIRLETEIDTKKSSDGDKFTAVVLSPERYTDATIEGHVAKINQSGKMTGKTELALDFDTVTLTSGEKIPFAAQLVRVYGEKKEVDEEGNVKSGSQGKETAIRSGGGAALGAIIGGIAGGGKGAAIGAAAGAGAGAGSTLITGSKKLKLESGTELFIRTTR